MIAVIDAFSERRGRCHSGLIRNGAFRKTSIRAQPDDLAFAFNPQCPCALQPSRYLRRVERGAGNAADGWEALPSASPVSVGPVEGRAARTCSRAYGELSSCSRARNNAALFSNVIASARTVGFTPAFASAAFNTAGP